MEPDRHLTFTVEQIRKWLNLPGESIVQEALENSLDTAQGEVFTQNTETYYILIEVKS